jgi:hypothetical protein
LSDLPFVANFAASAANLGSVRLSFSLSDAEAKVGRVHGERSHKMNAMRNILAIAAAAGLMAAGAGTAEAGVAVSVSFGSRVIPQPVIVQPAVVQPAIAQPVIAQPVFAQPTVMDLPNDQTVYPLSGYAGTWAQFRIYVPAGQTYLIRHRDAAG